MNPFQMGVVNFELQTNASGNECTRDMLKVRTGERVTAWEVEGPFSSQQKMCAREDEFHHARGIEFHITENQSHTNNTLADRI